MSFSPDYFAARDRFRAAAARLNWAVRSVPIDARGPGGEELTVDVALSAPTGPEPLLLVTSGVHGVEGLFGSAVQAAVMEEWHRTGPPAGVRYAFVHAVSPFGFAHVRRFDEANVDQNRNFLLDGEKYAGCPPIYAEIDAFLNPRRPPSRWDFFALRAALLILWYGYPPIKQAVAGGQYENPKGIFFGGHGPTPVKRLLRAELPRWVADAPAVVHLDFHTGLGRWGTYKLLAEDPFPPETAARVERWFGPGVYEPSEPRGLAYHTRGGFGRWCPTLVPDRDYLFLCAEFGTYSIFTVVGAVVAENRAFHWGRPGDPATRRAKARLLEAACPASPRWRARALAQAVRVVRQAVAGMRAEPDFGSLARPAAG